MRTADQQRRTGNDQCGGVCRSGADLASVGLLRGHLGPRESAEAVPAAGLRMLGDVQPIDEQYDADDHAIYGWTQVDLNFIIYTFQIDSFQTEFWKY